MFSSFNKMAVKQQFVLVLVLLILVSSVLSGVLAYRQAKQLVVNRMLQHEMPAVVGQIGETLEAQVSKMTMATRQLAENPYILQWAEQGFPPQEEALLLQQIRNVKNQLGLDAASWADRQTGRYWFTEPGGKVRMFVNYQQLNGRGLSGIAVSLQQMVDYLRGLRIADTGQAYLADGDGNIVIHPDTSLIGQQTMTQLYGSGVTGQLVSGKALHTQVTDDLLLVSVPVQGTVWSVVAQVPLTEVLARCNNCAIRYC